MEWIKFAYESDDEDHNPKRARRESYPPEVDPEERQESIEGSLEPESHIVLQDITEEVKMKWDEDYDIADESDEDHNPVIVKTYRFERNPPELEPEERQGSKGSLEPGSHIGEGEIILEEEAEDHPPCLKPMDVEEKENWTATAPGKIQDDPEMNIGTVKGSLEREDGFDKNALEVEKPEEAFSESEEDDEMVDTPFVSQSSSTEESSMSSEISTSESEEEREEHSPLKPKDLELNTGNEASEQSQEEMDIEPITWINTEVVNEVAVDDFTFEVEMPGNDVESFFEYEEDDGEVYTLSGNNLIDEVVLSGDDEEEEEAVADVNTSTNYTTRTNQKLEDDSDEDSDKKEEKILDVFDLDDKLLKEFIINPVCLDNITGFKIFYMDGTRDETISLASQLIKKLGDQIEAMFVCTKCDQKDFSFLSKVLKSAQGLKELYFKYRNEEAASQFLEILGKLRSENYLQRLSSLKLTSCMTSGREISLKEELMKKLCELDIPFKNLTLGDSLWEDVKPETVELLLRKNCATLKNFVIHGGFRGRENQEKKVIEIPEMKRLKSLSICPVDTFVSKQPKGQLKSGPRVINLEKWEGQVEFFKIGIKFVGETPALKRLELGSLIEIEDLQFSMLRKLETFKCGYNWNLGLKFPAEGVRQTRMESKITELQFPDGLKDPLFPVEIAKNFPKLEKVWINLPSVPVARAFFKAFENSEVEELFLQAQFDFQSTLECCLMPNIEDVTKMDSAQESLLKAVKEYKHVDEFVRYHNIQLPVTEEDLMEGHSAGIRALKNLKVFDLVHIPRTLSIPKAGEKRKWFDPRCQFRKKEEIGFKMYPLSVQCCKELISLKLDLFFTKFQICESVFKEATETRYNKHIPGRTEEENIFSRVKVGSSKGAKITIEPSMVSDVQVKVEREEEN